MTLMGILRFLKSYHHIKGSDKIEIKIRIDDDGDGKYDRSFSEFINNTQELKPSNDCDGQGTLDPQIKKILKTTALANKDNLPTGIGYTVDKACVEKWGPSF